MSNNKTIFLNLAVTFERQVIELSYSKYVLGIRPFLWCQGKVKVIFQGQDQISRSQSPNKNGRCGAFVFHKHILFLKCLISTIERGLFHILALKRDILSAYMLSLCLIISFSSPSITFHLKICRCWRKKKKENFKTLFERGTALVTTTTLSSSKIRFESLRNESLVGK